MLITCDDVQTRIAIDSTTHTLDRELRRDSSAFKALCIALYAHMRTSVGIVDYISVSMLLSI
jgi:hypothetical protein